MMKITQTTADAPSRADRVVQTLLELPARQSRAMFDHGCVQVNGQPCNDPAKQVQPGDKLRVEYDPHTRYKENRKKVWRDPAFSVVFEDANILIVDKVAGWLTVPTGTRTERDTLLDRVSNYLTKRNRRLEACIVHRLDRDVSGLLAFAKSERIADQLRNQFEARKPTREYIAIVAGELTPAKGTYRSYLATAVNLDQYSTTQPDKGQLAITHYKVTHTLAGATIVSVKLETGRRNQIRVHLAEAGHPILGDKRYAPDKAKHPRWKAKRIALHAATLGFDHPVTGKPVMFDSPLPVALQRFVGAARASRPQRPGR